MVGPLKIPGLGFFPAAFAGVERRLRVSCDYKPEGDAGIGRRTRRTRATGAQTIHGTAKSVTAKSGNGRWIVYASSESGSDEVYAQPFPSRVLTALGLTLYERIWLVRMEPARRFAPWLRRWWLPSTSRLGVRHLHVCVTPHVYQQRLQCFGPHYRHGWTA